VSKKKNGKGRPRRGTNFPRQLAGVKRALTARIDRISDDIRIEHSDFNERHDQHERRLNRIEERLGIHDGK
jgi:hypothetical protein